MRYLLIKNKKLYKNFFTKELNTLLYKNVIYNQSLPNYIRQFIHFNKKNTTSVCEIRQRCYFTNRSRSVISRYKLSRIKFRLLISKNNLNGFKKAS